MLPVYEGHRWYFVEEHIHDVLGKLDLESGRHNAALQHFAAIIACPNSPAYWQAFYLQQFLDCVKATAQSQVVASSRADCSQLCEGTLSRRARRDIYAQR